MTIDWERFVEVVGAHQRFLLSSHARPDCDALGSELGMAGVLEALGKEVRIVNPDPVPPALRFIDPQQRIRGGDEAAVDDALGWADLWMVLDTSSFGQLAGLADRVRHATIAKAVLDHHVSNDDLGAELFKDPAAEATGRLVLDAADRLNVALTPEIATPLFAAIATDTGWFRFPATTPGTYAAIGRLVAAGASPTAIYHDLYEQDSLARLRLRGRTMAKVQTELDGRLIYSSVLAEDLAATGALPSDTDEIINRIMTVAGVEAAALFMQVAAPAGADRFKVSFRSRGALDVNALAGQFGGGGHKAAAGATLDGDFETVRSRVLDALRRAMR